MDNEIKKASHGSEEVAQKPLSLGISERGVQTARDFTGLMSALMSDLIAGRISPIVGNAVCNAGGKMLKVVEMQMRYGQPNADGERTLRLVDGGK